MLRLGLGELLPGRGLSRGPWARRVGPLASGPGNVTRVNTARPCCQNRRMGSLTEPLSSESDLETLRLRVPGRQAAAALGPEGFPLKGPCPAP